MTNSRSILPKFKTKFHSVNYYLHLPPVKPNFPSFLNCSRGTPTITSRATNGPLASLCTPPYHIIWNEQTLCYSSCNSICSAIRFYKNKSIQSLCSVKNNIAEVEELQSDLMDEDLLEHILSLLQDSQMVVGVRYFAGGILAQLASRAEAWTLDHALRRTVLEQLVCVPVTEDRSVHQDGFFQRLFLFPCSMNQ